jgi:hypothetical protein
MDNGAKVLAAIGAAAFLLAAALYWFADSYQPDGLLGALQDALTPVYLLPFVLAGANVHGSLGAPFFIGLFIEAYLAIFAVLWLVSRLRSNR